MRSDQFLMLAKHSSNTVAPQRCWALIILLLHAVPTGLLALQGADELGSFLRSHLKDLGVRTDFIQGDVCLVLPLLLTNMFSFIYII